MHQKWSVNVSSGLGLNRLRSRYVTDGPGSFSSNGFEFLKKYKEIRRNQIIIQNIRLPPTTKKILVYIVS